jgi:hypothetical protein
MTLSDTMYPEPVPVWGFCIVEVHAMKLFIQLIAESTATVEAHARETQRTIMQTIMPINFSHYETHKAKQQYTNSPKDGMGSGSVIWVFTCDIRSGYQGCTHTLLSL